jgi:hypothetical protein
MPMPCFFAAMIRLRAFFRFSKSGPGAVSVLVLLVAAPALDAAAPVPAAVPGATFELLAAASGAGIAVPADAAPGVDVVLSGVAPVAVPEGSVLAPFDGVEVAPAPAAEASAITDEVLLAAVRIKLLYPHALPANFKCVLFALTGTPANTALVVRHASATIAN